MHSVLCQPNNLLYSRARTRTSFWFRLRFRKPFFVAMHGRQETLGQAGNHCACRVPKRPRNDGASRPILQFPSPPHVAADVAGAAAAIDNARAQVNVQRRRLLSRPTRPYGRGTPHALHAASTRLTDPVFVYGS